MKRSALGLAVISLGALLTVGCATAQASTAKNTASTAKNSKPLSEQSLSKILKQKISWFKSYSEGGTTFYVVVTNVPIPSDPMIRNAPDTVELVNHQGKIIWSSIKQSNANVTPGPGFDGMSGFNVVKIADKNEYLVYDDYIYGASGSGSKVFGVLTDGTHAYPFEHDGSDSQVVVNSTTGTIQFYDIHFDPNEDMAQQGNEWNKTTFTLDGSHTYKASTDNTIYSGSFVNKLHKTPFITIKP